MYCGRVCALECINNINAVSTVVRLYCLGNDDKNTSSCSLQIQHLSNYFQPVASWLSSWVWIELKDPLGPVSKGNAAKPEDLSSIPKTHMMEGKNDSHGLSSGLHLNK